MVSRVKFGVIGVDHGHIHGMIDGLLAAGAACVGWCTGLETPPEVKGAFATSYPEFPELSEAEILEDARVSLILSAAINSDRADIAIRAMRHGKDVLVDKPGCTTSEQLLLLKDAVRETGRRWIVCFSERLTVESTTVVDRLIGEGRIGQVIQTVGLGPHRRNAHRRPEWFWQRQRTGGILNDICAHQYDQFLHFTGSTEARVVAAHISNVANPERPDFMDFGEVLLEGNGGRGYARVDWLTPDGLPTWGDGRMTILGTEGYIEMRKYVDIAGQSGGDHVILVDGKGIERFNASGAGTPFFAKFLHDLEQRTETAMRQDHAFLATELSLQAQHMAEGEKAR
ncbi:Gfo/Idh/MocA family protein [Peteryoungia ipomoeae]|uniref:Gfo/Idh/MocA family oxidoreductase n=1 Tax=Peteryoungia ipomoeae TaxID=1210932 RepID=A0A4S8NSX5_9HYPH|nr:Gfo/Idh/MocA family oxidoreductase [Peteryoungia ipomoeae]THV20530.1 Gfo/Idh/MocA family oxidoreductase [Peteryoungia ipomoeae]